MNKVLIIGANGFVGNYLIKEYLEHNYKVIAMDLQDSLKYDYPVFYEKNDILDKNNLNQIIQKWQPDYLVNLVAISSVNASWSIPEKTFEVNVIGTINILESIKKFDPLCKVLLIGSSEEYVQKNKPLKETDELNANNPYGISKIAQENVAKMYSDRYGLNIVCVRSFNHIGPGQSDQFAIPSFCKQVAEIEKSGKPGKIYVGNLEAYRDISDVRDVVKAYRIVLEKHENLFDVFNIGSGKVYQIKDILNMIISFSSQPIEVIIDPNKMRPIDTPYICCNNEQISKKFELLMEYSIIDLLFLIFREYL